MCKCNCGKEFQKESSLKSHARFCKLYTKKKKKESIYKKKENLYECECGKIFEKSQSLNAHFSYCIVHRKGKKSSRIHKKGVMNGWSDFTTDYINNIRKKSGETLSKKIKSGDIISAFKGKKHTKISKEKISSSNTGRNNGYIKTKYYDVFCPYENKIVKVQGKWEFEYANFLNKNNIKWVRSRKIYFKYKLFKNDYWHTYYPDFYLIDKDEYIEIKGFWWKSSDGRVDDKRKMKMVKKYNIDKKITVITNLNFINL